MNISGVDIPQGIFVFYHSDGDIVMSHEEEHLDKKKESNAELTKVEIRIRLPANPSKLMVQRAIEIVLSSKPKLIDLIEVR